jgi:hypothetical protein
MIDSITETENLEALALRNEALGKANSELNKQVEYLRDLIVSSRGKSQREHKDKLFKFIFGNPENKQWTLSLYNAMNGSCYTNPEDISFNTLEDILYVRMKNDVSFMIMSVLNIWEHQSSFNPNMPLRFFLYASRLYDRYVFTHSFHKYSSRLQPIPTPKCVCFYNGTDDQPERTVLRLSQAYEGDGDIEVRVTMLNINYGKNKLLMDACEPLKEYSWFVYKVRVLQNEQTDIDAAMDMALGDMPDGFVLKAFLMAHRAEIKGMFLEDYNEESFRREMRVEGYEDGRKEGREEGRKEGREEGHEEGRKEGHEEVATNMLKKGMPLPLIAEVCMMPEDKIKELAAELGIELGSEPS